MIFSIINDADRAVKKDQRLSTGLSFLQSGVAAALPPGRYELGGDSVAVIDVYETAAPETRRFEAHEKHIDIQFVAMGVERICHAFVPDLTMDGGYDEEKDVTFFAEPAACSSLLAPAGAFAVFYPHDAHKPGLIAGAAAAIRKIVVKVSLAKT